MPEVLEFGYQPDVTGQQDDGSYEYKFVGSTCLAGDVFGSYRFAAPLEIGSKVVFEEAGAYTLAKAHRFNGINLPDIGVLGREGDVRVRKTSTYADFEKHWMANV